MPAASRAPHGLVRWPGAAETPVYRRDDLPAGAALEGPAIVEQLDFDDGHPARRVSAKVDRFLNIVMRMGG